MSKIILNILIAVIAILFVVTTDFRHLGVLDYVLIATLLVWGWTLIDRLISRDSE